MKPITKAEKQAVTKTSYVTVGYVTYVDKEMQLVPGYSPRVSYYAKYFAKACDIKSQKEIAGNFLFDEHPTKPSSNLSCFPPNRIGEGSLVYLKNHSRIKQIAEDLEVAEELLSCTPLMLVSITPARNPNIDYKDFLLAFQEKQTIVRMTTYYELNVPDRISESLQFCWLHDVEAYEVEYLGQLRDQVEKEELALKARQEIEQKRLEKEAEIMRNYRIKYAEKYEKIQVGEIYWEGCICYKCIEESPEGKILQCTTRGFKKHMPIPVPA